MKKTFLFFFILFTVFAEAQTFTITPNDSLESTNDINDWLSDYIYINNNSGAALNLSFQTITNTMDPLGWDVLLCTSNGCYSYLPSSGSLGNIANGGSGHLNLHNGFVGIAGTGEVSVRVFETGNPTNADTITFIYHAFVASGIADNLESDLSYSKNYPNPFSQSTTISYKIAKPNGKLVITDVKGRIIEEFILNDLSGKVVLTGYFTPGVYFSALYCEDKMISVQRMVAK
ncbi:MAG: Secretion system C-terminal sorting domain [Bacteroidetes bacterium]|jgi:hypothetical protein|nr:Secretion system C-terminal sorting domain [Bacteroidota bacterium]